MRRTLKIRQRSGIEAIWLYQPILGWLLFVCWFIGSATFSARWADLREQSERLGRWSLGRPLPRLQLVLRDVDAQRAGLLFEVSVQSVDAEMPLLVSSRSRMPMLTVSLPANAAATHLRWLNIRVAAWDEKGCIRYGGEHVVIAPSDADFTHAATIEVAMRQLPAALCV